MVLVLDSLDQLSDDDGGRELEWVPKELPDNVYIILSTLPGKEHSCFPSLEVINVVVVTSRYNEFARCIICLSLSPNFLYVS